MSVNIKYTPIRLAIVILVISLFLSGCALKHVDKVDKTNFSLIFRFGCGGGKNILNTIDNTFEKDMVVDPPAITSLSLSEEELNKIYQKMVEIDFFNYPDYFSIYVPKGALKGIVTPYETYYFKVECNSKVKELYWEDRITNEDKKADRLRELIELIKDITYSKKEYKELPEARGVYI